MQSDLARRLPNTLVGPPNTRGQHTTTAPFSPLAFTWGKAQQGAKGEQKNGKDAKRQLNKDAHSSTLLYTTTTNFHSSMCAIRQARRGSETAEMLRIKQQGEGAVQRAHKAR
ncbi:hypothetical protein MTO96_018850 [Rhipicephalus appendiculatus]